MNGETINFTASVRAQTRSFSPTGVPLVSEYVIFAITENDPWKKKGVQLIWRSCGELEQHRQRWQRRERQQKQNNNFARAAHFLVHFISLVSWLHKPGVKFPYAAFMQDVKTQRLFFFSFLKLSAVPKNLTRRKFTCIWHNYHFFAEKVPLSCYIRYTFLWQIVSLSHASMNNSQNQDVFTTFSQP